MNPRYPIFIVSKGRAHTRLTVKALTRMGIPFRVVIELSDWYDYSQVIDPDDLLIMPSSYLNAYDTCDDLGKTKSKGPGAARNFAMDIAKSEGFKRHWVMDDNLDDFHRLHQNMKVPVRTGSCFAAAEDFVDRYRNVPLAGLNYYSFCKASDSYPPYVLNTRIYSCLLLDNDSGYRWRGRYNEDTDLSLRILKDGFCTIQFNAFLCGKVTTQRMKGGNTEDFYKEDGTKAKSQMIADLHPDVCEVVWKFNRWHHQVDYGMFRGNVLKKVVGVDIPTGVNNYGMKLIEPMSKQRD